MRLENVLFGIDYMSVSAVEEYRCVDVSDITDASADCVEGSIFVCIEGQRCDGHAFADEAVKNGASVVVCSRGRGEEIRRFTALCGSVSVIEVENTRSAYAKMCGNFYGVYGSAVKIVCVTGTNGKTSVSTLIRDGLTAYGRRAALLGTLGGSFEGTEYSCGTMTTPDPKRLYGLLSEFISRGAEYIVMEASSHALALHKLDGLCVYMGVFTNLTPEHLDFHGDMDGYEKAKTSLFEKCEYRGVFFADDIHAQRMASALPDGVGAVSCSLIDKNADYFAYDIAMLGENGVRYAVIHGDYSTESVLQKGKTELFCGIAGEVSVYNSLVAFATLCELGIPPVCASGGITSCKGVKGRMERVSVPAESGISVFIDFAHTPDALSKLLRSVRAFCRAENRIVAVFGCGGDRDRSKRSLMGAIATELADFTVITADNSRSEPIEAIINDILSGVDRSRPYKIIPDRRAAIEFALESAAAGDIILLCGKGHEEYEIGAEGMLPFSERQTVAEFFGKRGGNGGRK